MSGLVKSGTAFAIRRAVGESLGVNKTDRLPGCTDLLACAG